jgi:O-antigen/teichoic acid export membrane protein
MRIKKAMKNSIYSITSYTILFALGLVMRKVFLTHLNVEYLGYETLFVEIFVLISLAEAGVGSVITYKLYHQLAENNKEEIAKLMMIYKYMYRIIGLLVLILGLILMLFLPYIITGNETSWDYIRYIYLIQLGSTVTTFFLAYRRTIYIANQQEYICVKVDAVVNILSYIAKILVLIFTKSYIFYLFITLAQHIISNSMIAFKSNRDFPYTKYVKISKADFQRHNVFGDLKNYLVHKVAYTIYSGTDSIVISAALGISSVGLYSNYLLIRNQVRLFIRKLLSPIQAGIGNLVYSDDSVEKGKKLFYAFDLFSFFVATSVGTCFLVLYQPFIEMWLGKEYLLSDTFVTLLSITVYMSWIQEFLVYFRNVFGNYEKDMKYMIISAVSNVVLSIVLVWNYGLSGILVGTVIGILFIWYGRVKFVFENYLKVSYRKYIVIHAMYFLIATLEGLLVLNLTEHIPISVTGIILRIGAGILIPLVINIIIFNRNQNFMILVAYLKKVYDILINYFRRTNSN